MWREEEHPRDEKGQFTEKALASKLLGVELDDEKPRSFKGNFNSIQEFRDYQNTHPRYKTKELLYTDGLNISTANLEKIMSWYNGVIPKNILFAGKYWNLAQNKNQLDEFMKKGLQDAIKRYENKLEYDQRWQEKKQLEEKKYRDYAEESGFSLEMSKKLLGIIDEIYRYNESLQQKQMFEKHKGYGSGESMRSIQAKLDGKYPLAVAKKMFGLPESKIKNNFKKSEWHHTGALYNETDYYDMSDLVDALQNDDFEYIKKIYE